MVFAWFCHICAIYVPYMCHNLTWIWHNFDIIWPKVNYGNLWHFCKYPVCPDPVWKSVNIDVCCTYVDGQFASQKHNPLLGQHLLCPCLWSGDICAAFPSFINWGQWARCLSRVQFSHCEASSYTLLAPTAVSLLGRLVMANRKCTIRRVRFSTLSTR